MNLRTVCLALAVSVALPFAVARAAQAKPDQPLHISRGEKIELAEYLVEGKTTIFDFYSDYCPPCVSIAPALEKLHQERPDIVVVKVDINRRGHKGIDWKSPVAQQYGLKSIPHFKIFGPDGKLVAEDRKGSALVRSWLK